MTKRDAQMWRYSLIVGSVCAVLGTTLQARAQNAPTDPNKTFNPVARFMVGDVLHYKMQINTTTTIKAPGASQAQAGAFAVPIQTKMDASLRMKTAGIMPDGSGVIATKVESGHVSVMGQEKDLSGQPDMMMEIAPHGNMKIRNAGAVPGAEMLTQMFNVNNMPGMGVSLPDHPVKIGDTWTSETPVQSGGSLKFSGTLLGTEVIGGVETLKIKGVATMPLSMNIGSNGKPSSDAANALMSMTGTITTSAIYNLVEQNARLVRTVADLIGNMEMTMKGAAAAQSPIGGKIGMTVEGKLSVDLTSASKVPAK